jgi:hypothetical protein
LAELSQDPDFRASVWRMAEHHAAVSAQSDTLGLHREPAAAVGDQIGPVTDAAVPNPTATCFTVIDPPANTTPVNGNGIPACATRAFATRVDRRNVPARNAAVSR